MKKSGNSKNNRISPRGNNLLQVSKPGSKGDAKE